MSDGGLVSTGENGGGFCGSQGMLQRQPNRWASPARCTPANRVDHHQDSAASGRQEAVDVGGGSSLLYAITSQVRPHGRDELFGICHALDSSSASCSASSSGASDVVVETPQSGFVSFFGYGRRVLRFLFFKACLLPDLPGTDGVIGGCESFLFADRDYPSINSFLVGRLQAIQLFVIDGHSPS
jgi:hypothetical protein